MLEYDKIRDELIAIERRIEQQEKKLSDLSSPEDIAKANMLIERYKREYFRLWDQLQGETGPE